MDWNSAAEETIVAGLALVPDVGPILGGLVKIFWPSDNTDVWGQIKAKVEALVDQKLDETVYSQLQAKLAGLQNVVNDYLLVRNSGAEPVDIRGQWRTTEDFFAEAEPEFQVKGYEVLLLPLFAQFANMHLSHLREGVQLGASWGMVENELERWQATLTSSIENYVIYANTTYGRGLAKTAESTKRNDHECQSFRALNRVRREMTLMVIDFAQLWPYFDPSLYPKPVRVVLEREIYTDPVGTCDNSGEIKIPTPPNQPMSQITVWGWDYVFGIEATYPTTDGPGGKTSTGVMGTRNGIDKPPHGGSFDVSNNPIVTVSGAGGDIVNSLRFTFADGTQSGTLGGARPGGNPFVWGFDGEIVSSVWVNGVSEFYGTADSLVVGFKYAPTPRLAIDTFQRLYVANPLEVAPEDMLKDAAIAGPEGVDLAALAAREGWQAARQAYWRALAASATSRRRT
jgi:hypothetical protein